MANIRKIILSGTAIALIALASPAQSDQGDSNSQNFIRKASEATQFEVMASQLALEKSRDSRVKDLAEQMIKDHSKVGNQLRSIIQSSPEVSYNHENLSPDHQKTLNNLKETNGMLFDKEYLKVQEQANKEAIGLFSQYARSGDNNTLKGFASGTLPTLEKNQLHVDHVRSNI